jgi:hypothetical protein
VKTTTVKPLGRAKGTSLSKLLPDFLCEYHLPKWSAFI